MSKFFCWIVFFLVTIAVMRGADEVDDAGDDVEEPADPADPAGTDPMDPAGTDPVDGDAPAETTGGEGNDTAPNSAETFNTGNVAANNTTKIPAVAVKTPQVTTAATSRVSITTAKTTTANKDATTSAGKATTPVGSGEAGITGAALTRLNMTSSQRNASSVHEMTADDTSGAPTTHRQRPSVGGLLLLFAITVACYGIQPASNVV